MNIENEYNKRFNNQQLPNEAFDTEGLWEAVADGLDTDESQNPNPIMHRNWFYTTILLVFLGALLTLLFYCDHQQNKAFVNNNIALNNEVETNKGNTSTLDIPSKVDGNVYNPTSSKNTRQSDSQLNPIRHDKYIPQKTSSGNWSSSENRSFEPKLNKTDWIQAVQYPSNSISKPNNPTNPSLSISQSNTAYQKEKTSLRTTLNEQEIKTAAPNSIERSVDLSQHDHFNTSNPANPILSDYQISRLPSKVSVVNPTITALNLPERKRSIKNGNSKLLTWQVGLFAGTNNIKFNYKSVDSVDLATLKSQTETGQWGTSFGFRSSILLKNKWLFSSGLEYHSLFSKFEHKQIESTQILKENELLGILVNVVSGDTVNLIYGDTLVDAISTRHVLHHNRYQRFTIPLEIGFKQNMDKLLYGISAGASFNFTTLQSGMTLDRNVKIVPLDNNGSVAPFNSFNIGIRVRPILGYQIHNNWAITFQPQWSWIRRTGIDETDLKMSAHQLNLNFGLEYSFNGVR